MWLHKELNSQRYFYNIFLNYTKASITWTHFLGIDFQHFGNVANFLFIFTININHLGYSDEPPTWMLSVYIKFEAQAALADIFIE